MTPSAPRVEVTATIRAPRERVFDAWLSPERLGRFLCAGDTHVASIQVDARVGGAFEVVMADERGRYEHRGRYLAIERPQRLQFTWLSAATGEAETIVTITFESTAEGTRLTLVHVGLLDQATASRHQGGWTSIVEKCAHELALGGPLPPTPE